MTISGGSAAKVQEPGKLRHKPFAFSMPMEEGDLIRICQAAIFAEAKALSQFGGQLGQEFLSALKILRGSAAPLVVAGIGKSGHVARKIASTFSSIGLPSVFVHAAEASHGDLGLIQKEGAVLILSNSGETSELSDLIQYCKRHEIPIIALTARAESTLARNATVTIAYGEIEEVCPNGLAPTTSTTLSMAIGDALAVGLTYMLQTAPEDFRRYHPGGKLGAKLLRVSDLMHRGDALPIVSPAMAMAEVVVVISEKSFGVAIVAENEEIRGIITDGDMRRNVGRLWHCKAEEIATPNPVLVREGWLAADVVKLMTARAITACLVADEDGRLKGLLHIHDCLRAGIA